MNIILNNMDMHPIPISEFAFDYLNHNCHVANTWENGIWSDELIQFLRALTPEIIDTITVKDGNTVVREYINLKGKINTLDDLIEDMSIPGVHAMSALDIEV